MSRFKCTCGNIFNMAISPSKYEFTLIQNSLIDDIAIGIDEGSINSNLLYEIVDQDVNLEALLCDKCERIWVWEGEYYRSYIKESDGKQV